MNEKEFGQKIRERLNQGTQQIDGITLNRLEQARQRALGKIRVAERQVAMAESHGRGGSMSLRIGGGSSEHHPHYLRMLFVGLALIAGMAGTVYWHQANEDDDDEQGMLDAKMLSSELPLHAFLHPDFKEWVDSSR